MISIPTVPTPFYFPLLPHFFLSYDIISFFVVFFVSTNFKCIIQGFINDIPLIGAASSYCTHVNEWCLRMVTFGFMSTAVPDNYGMWWTHAPGHVSSPISSNT